MDQVDPFTIPSFLDRRDPGATRAAAEAAAGARHSAASPDVKPPCSTPAALASAGAADFSPTPEAEIPMNDDADAQATPPTPAEEAETVATDTMAGDLTTWLVDRMKHMPKTWQELTGEEQAALIESASLTVKAHITTVVRTLAREGRATITATLDKVVIKDGIQAVLQLSKSDPHRHALADSQGSDVLIVVADAEAYMGGEVPTPDANQGALPLEESGDAPLFDRTEMGKAA